MRRLRSMLVTLALAALGSARAEAPVEAALEKARLLIEAECTAGRFSGVALIAKEGEERLFLACGRESYPNGPPISRSTRFKYFSTSKQLTAAAAMRLEAQGRLTLDDTVGAWIPEAPPAWKAASVRQLLTHTAGVPDDVNGYANLYETDALQAMSAWFAAQADTPLDFTPGAAHRYSNMGYETLALILSRAGAADFSAVLQRDVLDPAGMTTAFLERPALVEGKAAGSAPDPLLAQGYVGEPGRLEPAVSWVFVIEGSGALHGTVDDLLAYDAALREGRVLSQAAQRRMWEEGFEVRPGVAYGYGWVVRRTAEGAVSLNHSGGTNGFANDFARLPESGWTVILLNNFGFSEVESYRQRIIMWLSAAEAGVIASGAPSQR